MSKSGGKKDLKRGLGRGLGALIPSAPAVVDDADDADAPGGAPAHGIDPGPSTGARASDPGAVPDGPTAPAWLPARPDGSAAVAATPSAAAVAGAVAGADRSLDQSIAGRAGDPARAQAVYAELPVDAIVANPRQPRQVFDEEALAELVHSITEIGLLQPIVVRPALSGYEIVAGERRWRAAAAAGMTEIPAIIRQTDDDALLRDALLENLHRADLNPLEEAAAYSQLLSDFGCTQDQLAERLGRSRPQVSNTLRLLRLPPAVQARVAAGVLSAGHARALLGLSDEADMERLATRIVAEGLSVRAVEEIVLVGDGDGRARKRTPRPRGPRPQDPATAELVTQAATRLADRLETRVTVEPPRSARGTGRVVVEFADLDDLRRLVDLVADSRRS